ncbi:MAG: nuclear transport factor 2 family protein [Novosphingobium sp.]
MPKPDRPTPYTAPQELHDLAFRYGLAVDNLDAAMLGSIFTAQGVIRGHGHSGARYLGADGWQRMIAEVQASFQRTMHNVFNQTFEQAPDGTLTGLTTGIASHLLPADPGTKSHRVLDFAMRYHNRYAVEGGAWKFAERALEVLWVETREAQQFNLEMLGRELKGFTAVD